MAVVIWRRVVASVSVLALLLNTHGAGLGIVANSVVAVLCMVVILASVPATWVRPRRKELLPKDVEEELVTSGRTFDQHCLFGTHNSTHQCSVFGWLLVSSWRFTHASLLDQLDDGIRTIELDIWYNIGKKSWEVRHENLIDCLTTADTPEGLEDTLRSLFAWSEAHSAHFPLVINLDIKGSFQDGLGWAAPLIGRGLGGSCTNSESAYRKLQEVIEGVWGEDKVFTPRSLKEHHGAPEMGLRECVSAYGWPQVGELKGKSIFLLNLYGKIKHSARACDASFFFVRGHDHCTDSDAIYFESGVQGDTAHSTFMWRALSLSTHKLNASLYALDDLSAIARSVAPLEGVCYEEV